MSRQQVTKKNEQEFSKFLSFILRHKPEEIGLSLEDNGWISTQTLINAINNHSGSNWLVSLEILREIVAGDNKGRYSFNSDGTKIRANQGHSIKNLKIEFKEANPLPEYLYHGTSKKNWELIQKSGCIKPMTRQLVHLSRDIDTASKVGLRHGDLVILEIDTSMLKEKYKIYISENGVYLAEQVPLNCINSL